MVNRMLVGMAALVALSFVVAPLAHAGTLKGTVTYGGDKMPKVKTLKLDADAKCKAAHPGGKAKDDHYKIGAAKELEDAVVYIRKGLPKGKEYPTPSTPVQLNQKGCMYEPKVFGVQTNQKLKIVNSDATLHNVHAIPKSNPGFNIGMPRQGMVNDKKSFPNPEVAVKIKCDVHPWMWSYAAVLPHPFFSVTSADGSYEIKDLPAGDYTVEAYHSKLGRTRKDVTVGASDTKTLDISLERKKKK